MWKRARGREQKKEHGNPHKNIKPIFPLFLTANLTVSTSIGTMNLDTVIQTSCFPPKSIAITGIPGSYMHTEVHQIFSKSNLEN